MHQAYQARLARIVDATLPAGSADARTMGIALLAEVLDELRAIRQALEPDVAPDVPAAADPGELLTGRSAAVCRAIGACDNAGVLARCMEIETAKTRPRSTVVAAIRARIQDLA